MSVLTLLWTSGILGSIWGHTIWHWSFLRFWLAKTDFYQFSGVIAKKKGFWCQKGNLACTWCMSLKMTNLRRQPHLPGGNELSMKYCQVYTISHTKSQNLNVSHLILQLSSPIYWSQVLNQTWRCSWSSANRQWSNYIWVINNIIAYKGATYIRGLMVYDAL